MIDEEFRARREAKIAEIRRTGKTWQWPDSVQHPEWTRAHLAVLASAALIMAVAILVAVTW